MTQTPFPASNYFGLMEAYKYISSLFTGPSENGFDSVFNKVMIHINVNFSSVR